MLQINLLVIYAVIAAAAATHALDSKEQDNLTMGPEVTVVTTSTSLKESEEKSSTVAAVSSTMSHVVASTVGDIVTETSVVSEVSPQIPTSSASQISLPQENENMKRRLITYDQRQDGQYNIRADLENFMIVLIPPSPTDGLNLLDLLNKASYTKRAPESLKGKKKYYMNMSPAHNGLGKYPLHFKKGLFSSESNVRGSSNSDTVQLNESPVKDEVQANTFIEGRSPYHVDITSTNEDLPQSRMQPELQVDVLPPAYPLVYQQLVKPYHLDAEATVIQALPPSGVTGQTITENHSDNAKADYYRLSRSINGNENYLQSNRLTNSLRNMQAKRLTLPLYRSEFSMGASQYYPPLDVPHYASYLTLNSPNGKLNAHNSEMDFSPNEVFIPPAATMDVETEMELENGGFMDAATKALLGDGIERCAPGKRRDSYGVCREIDGY